MSWLYRCILVYLTYLACLALPRVIKDELKKLQSGTTRIFLGVIIGDISTIGQGVEEGGNIKAPLQPLIASTVLLLGEPYVDYPICPPIHMAFNLGMKEHLNVASHLLRLGADVCDYRLPAYPKSYSDRGYPPAMLYTIGLGQKPNNSHAALLQRIYRSYSDRFNLSKIEEWRERTDNPPLLHMSVALGNFDATYVLMTEFTTLATIYTADQFNMTALHVAAWHGDLQAIIFLLYNGADVLARDAYGNTALHLAMCRHHIDALALLLATAINSHKAQPDRRKAFLKLLHAPGYGNRALLDLALLAPVHIPSLHLIVLQAELLNIPLQDLCNKPHQHDMMAFLLSHEPAGQVDVLSAQGLTKQHFLEHYFVLQRPALITDQAARGMGIWAYMDSRDNFLARFGDLTMEVVVDSGGGTPLLYSFSSLTSFFQEHLQLPADDWTSVSDNAAVKGEAQDDIATLLHAVHSASQSSSAQVSISYSSYTSSFFTDLQVPELFQLCGDNDQDTPFRLTASSSQHLQPMQSHNASYNLLLAGRQLWVLLRPGWASNASLLQEIEADWQLGREQWGQASGRDWMQHVLLPFYRHNLLVFVEQSPGDVLFVPHDWPYLVLALQPSLSLAHEFCSYALSDMRVQPLGYRLYGGKDAYRGYGFYKTHVKSNYKPAMSYKVRKQVPMFEYPIR